LATENIFTNLWTGPYDGQLAALDAFRFSESPRRLTAVNLYYHFYSGERMAGVKTLQTLYRWCESQPLAPVRASDYARIVEGFYAGRITADGPDVWRVSDHGACRTLRFDHEARIPDLAQSQGVAGYCRTNGALYVHLLPGAVQLKLAAQPALRPHLESASAPLQQWHADARGLTAAFTTQTPLSVTLAGFSPRQTLRLTGAWQGSRQADADGRLQLTGPAGNARLEVHW
jgi:hypothetical protein